MNKEEVKEEKRQERIRKIDKKIDNLRYERRQIEKINEEDDYIFRYQEKNLEYMYNSTNDNKLRALIDEIYLSKKKQRKEANDTLIELMNKFDISERNIEEEREKIRKEDENKEKKSNNSIKENEKDNRWF